MSQKVADMGGSEVRFDHGLAAAEGRADVYVTMRALRRGAKFTDDRDEEERFMAILGHLRERKAYTEGQHPVSAYVSEDDVGFLHLAHMIAVEHTPEWDDDIRQTFEANKRALPTTA